MKTKDLLNPLLAFAVFSLAHLVAGDPAWAQAQPAAEEQPTIEEGMPDEPAATTWTCWFSGSTRIACRLAAAPADSGTASAEAPTDPAFAGLPPIVHQILEQPASLADRIIVIPMFSPPTNPDMAIQLAEAVMCGARDACQVEFVSELSMVAPLEEVDPALD